MEHGDSQTRRMYAYVSTGIYPVLSISLSVLIEIYKCITYTYRKFGYKLVIMRPFVLWTGSLMAP